MVKKEDIINLR